MNDIEAVQAEHRRKIVSSWGDLRGQKVLEIGCGQGDMTAILAEAVGPRGSVLAIDQANRDYGSPLTLGQATDILKASPLGERVQFRFNCDLLEPGIGYEEGVFDSAVLALCSWYFASVDQLVATLRRIKPWTRQLLLAEWEIVPRSMDQVAHFVAVLMQGQTETFNPSSVANVRTPLSRQQMHSVLQSAGWTLSQETVIKAEEMQDADWEINACLLGEWAGSTPSQLNTLLELEGDVLRQLARPRGNHSLDIYSLVAI